MMKQSKVLSVLLAVSSVVMIASLAVVVTLAWRGFYAMNVEWYEIDRYIGVTKDVLVQSYGEVMDYCTGVTASFSAGIFPFSAEGEAHFVDVRNIFIAIDWIFRVSAPCYIACCLIARKLRPYRFFGRSPEFFGVVGLTATLAVVGIYAALDFNRAFTVFHMIFFPGKTNWVFDWQTDPVILALPEEFFRNCAILIGGIVLLWCVGVLVREVVTAQKQ